MVKNFSLQCYVTTGIENEKLKNFIVDFKGENGDLVVEKLTEKASSFPGMRIFLNGLWLGNISVENGKLLAQDLKQKRAKKDISFEVSITVSEND